MAGVSETTVCRWISGKCSARLVNVVALAQGTQTPICYWVDDRWPLGQHGKVPPAIKREYATHGGYTGLVSDGRGAGLAADGEALSAAERAVIRELEGLWEAIPQAVESIRAGRMPLPSAAALAQAVHTLSRLIEGGARGK